ncbi:NHL repeat-containing protein [Nonlabens ponticola]|uniref:6-bladed beta-propeller n=1 Tax=Nonlabens ponticola TaxID=2496866 RepID=A0A3S9N088_9FLAO|nr:NHL repeat-containing protein [Nonlabens ponticola]AZQ44955.1 hypothetical protein EJ995_12235 [Nonlabens ponticola]
MKKFLYIIPIVIGMISCKEDKPIVMEWQLDKVIEFDGINPIGLASYGENIAISDGDHNRLVMIDQDGTLISEVADFDRPMHIDVKNDIIYVPEYGRDSIAMVANQERSYLKLSDSLDAPAGISIFNNEIAIADFYNNKIHYNDGSSWSSFGKEGKALGDFYYPTDVQITDDYIYVADAYNNRGQVFDKSGKVIKAFGEDQNFNAATGIYVSDQEIFLTDFENNRVVIFSKDYTVQQVIESGIDKPTDMIVVDNQLFITNYRKGELVIYKLQQVSS